MLFRRAVAGCLCVLFSLLVPAVAPAQGCHLPPLTGASTPELRASFTTAVASFRTPSYTGEYQGVFAGIAWTQRYFSADLTVPGYRIVRNGLRDYGVGDVGLTLRGPVFRDAAHGLSAGPALAVTAPTGDAQKQLGMGHTMLMPGGFLSAERGRFSLFLQLAYGRALTSKGGAHAHHGGLSPIVNPMNRSELEHALSATYGVVETLWLTARLYGAVPIAHVAGVAREAIAVGLVAALGRWKATLEVHVPVVSAQFEQKSVVGLSAGF